MQVHVYPQTDNIPSTFARFGSCTIEAVSEIIIIAVSHCTCSIVVLNKVHLGLQFLAKSQIL